VDKRNALTRSFDIRARVKVLEDKSFIRPLAVQVVPPLTFTVSSVVMGADAALSDRVRLNEVLVGVDCCAVTHTQGPLVDWVYERFPDTLNKCHISKARDLSENKTSSKTHLTARILLSKILW